jgi:hypothetical protein
VINENNHPQQFPKLAPHLYALLKQMLATPSALPTSETTPFSEGNQQKPGLSTCLRNVGNDSHSAEIGVPISPQVETNKHSARRKLSTATTTTTL